MGARATNLNPSTGMMSNRFVAAVEAAALETAAVLPRCALGNINPNFDVDDSVFNDESRASKKVVKRRRQHRRRRRRRRRRLTRFRL